jgi:hypothetical protein
MKMLERRMVHRRRVCLEGAVACGLTGPISMVRVRNLSARGAEIVVPDGGLSSPDLALSVEQAAVLRQARVVWRRMDRFGLEFAPAPPGEDNGAVPDLLGDLLARRAGRKN